MFDSFIFSFWTMNLAAILHDT